MQQRAPKLTEIAERLDISAATVSNALSGKGRVSADLAKRIRQTADELGYVPSLSARALRTGQTGVIGLVLPDIGNPLFPQIAQAIENAATDAGLGVLIADSRGSIQAQTEAIRHLKDHGVDGMIVVPRRGTRVSDIGCPVAMIDSPSTPGNTVSADHWGGGFLLGEHLAALGHRKILLIGNHRNSIVQNDRLGGVRAALAAATTKTIWLDSPSMAEGNEFDATRWYAEGYTAFVTVSDLQALKVLTHLQNAGIGVPAMASVSGFDDLMFASVVTPALTTVRMDMPAVAEIAIAALKQVIETRAEADGQTVKAARDRVPMTLVVRRSTGPAQQEEGKKPAFTKTSEGELDR
ncbi:LacI family DNA-binding transcriptional regulator [Martelella lutilitoris]|uniref:LacI family DNA-binding transcriptional regulator n=1 Tax=Martelella lutilitoris TaxID=2583532 RepID=A0A7T7KM04_9HYPH|nr:LacI family DNA-binding transcriptional regulator [Martelella lutilitoris]QQM30409.1 LacI family DNA-binding transcriptional regulator [Martelella lutilitoris]